jgi:hypothetical protein
VNPRNHPHLFAYSSPATETFAAKKQPPLWLSLLSVSLFPAILILSMAAFLLLAMLWVNGWVN